MDRNLNLANEKELTALGKALSSETRIRILHLLGEGSLCVNEIAEMLEIPSSSAALNIRVLEDAGLIRTELKPAARGSMKMCIPQEGKIILDFQRQPEKKKEEIISMPVGNYVDYKITPTCGMVNEEGYIDGEDEPRCFYDPKRTTAKLIWFSSGYLEYRFPNAVLQEQPARVLEFSAELCSEAPDYNLDYPSDITLWINGKEAGTWCCPSDFGGRRGKLNPDWWEDTKSQYGNLKTWRLDPTGSYLDGKKSASFKIQEYCLEEGPYISVVIGIKDQAEHVGGVNIFGSCFGDYPQDLVMKVKF